MKLKNKFKREEVLLLKGYFTLSRTYKLLKEREIDNSRKELAKGMTDYEENPYFMHLYNKWLESEGEELKPL